MLHKYKQLVSITFLAVCKIRYTFMAIIVRGLILTLLEIQKVNGT